MKFVDELGR